MTKTYAMTPEERRVYQVFMGSCAAVVLFTAWRVHRRHVHAHR